MANFITGLGVIFALLSAVSVCFGDLLIASLLFYCSFVLDFVDGKVARLRKSSSHLGKKLDLACDRFIFVTMTLVYLYYFENNEMQLEKSLLAAFAIIFLLLDVLESVDSMVWQREIIENLLAGRSVDSNFGINTFRADSTKASGLNVKSYFATLFSVKKWFPSKLSLTAVIFIAAPLICFEFFYILAATVLLIRMLWFLSYYFASRA